MPLFVLLPSSSHPRQVGKMTTPQPPLSAQQDPPLRISTEVIGTSKNLFGVAIEMSAKCPTDAVDLDEELLKCALKC